MVNHPNRSARDPANRVGLVQIAIECLKEAREALRAARCPNATARVIAALKSAEGAARHVETAGDGLEQLVTRQDFDPADSRVRVRVWDTGRGRWYNGTILHVDALDAAGNACAWAIELDNGNRGSWGRAYVELLP